MKYQNERNHHKVSTSNDDNILEENQLKACLLHHKYADSASEFQINLSDGKSKKLANQLVNINDRNSLNKEDLRRI